MRFPDSKVHMMYRPVNASTTTGKGPQRCLYNETTQGRSGWQHSSHTHVHTHNHRCCFSSSCCFSDASLQIQRFLPPLSSLCHEVWECSYCSSCNPSLPPSYTWHLIPQIVQPPPPLPEAPKAAAEICGPCSLHVCLIQAGFPRLSKAKTADFSCQPWKRNGNMTIVVPVRRGRGTSDASKVASICIVRRAAPSCEFNRSPRRPTRR